MTNHAASIIGAKPADYAGDVTVEEAFRWLGQSETALIDVRTMAEWSFVGRPDLRSLDKEVACVEWQSFPTMERNENFVSDVKRTLQSAGLSEASTLFLICRSGARSRSAAIALTTAGVATVFNVAGGFEGDLDSEQRRGHTNGWKAAGLPWSQT